LVEDDYVEKGTDDEVALQKKFSLARRYQYSSTDLLSVLKGEDPPRPVHWFVGASLSIHLQAGFPARYPYPLLRTWGYG